MKKFRLWLLKKMLKFIVKHLDNEKLQGGRLMNFSWGKDEITSYHLIVEKCYENEHWFGTKCEKYPEHKAS